MEIEDAAQHAALKRNKRDGHQNSRVADLKTYYPSWGYREGRGKFMKERVEGVLGRG